ncbi:MAG: response regulator [Clostridiales bacterium]|nr:response regulator [Clostridiales bacterium]
MGIKETDKKIILAVDDTPSSLQIVHSALGREFDVRLAKSGSAAMSVLERVKADLILLDIEMPGISGFDIMDLLANKPQLSGIPVIFVTSHATESFVKEAAQKGAADYIVKPFAPDVLRNKAYRALGMARPSAPKTASEALEHEKGCAH